MAQQILSLKTDSAALRALAKEIKTSARRVELSVPTALREALARGKIAAEDVANNYWNGIESYVEKNTYTSRVTRRSLEGKIYQSGRKIELHRFMSKEDMLKQYYAGENVPAVRPPGVRVKVYRGQAATIYPGTFVQRMRSGFLSVFKRVGKTWNWPQRLPIKVQYANEDLNYPLLQNIAKFERYQSRVFEQEINLAFDKLFPE